MKIVVLDGYTENPGDLSWSALEQLGELVVYDRTSYEESDLVAERIGDADVAILNKTPISKVTMDQCPNLKLIAVLATGYNVVDIAYAKEKGIPVCNVPNYGGYSSASFAIGPGCWRPASTSAITTVPSTRVSGRTARSVLLGLSPHRGGGKTYGLLGLRPHRHPHCRGGQGAGNARHRL